METKVFKDQNGEVIHLGDRIGYQDASRYPEPLEGVVQLDDANNVIFKTPDIYYLSELKSEFIKILARNEKYEMVDQPAHYNQHPTGIAAIDIIEHIPSSNVASAMRYLWRLGLKPGNDFEQELDKVVWYTKREKERLIKLRDGGTKIK